MDYLFENYHRHSMYTNPRISDCAVSNKDYAKRAVELGHQVLSSCEHAWQGNVWDVHKLAQEFKLKKLVAAEAYWVKDRLENPIALIARIIEGRDPQDFNQWSRERLMQWGTL